MQQTRQQNIEDWDTASGLPDDYDFDVHDAYFGYVDTYRDAGGNLQPLLIWEGTDRQGYDRIQEVFSIGSGWTIIDNGERVIAPEVDTPTKRKLFIKSTIYGTLIDAVGDTMGLKEWMARRGSTREAHIWSGLSFHMKRVEIKYGGRLQDRVRPMPVSFNGEIEPTARTVVPPTPQVVSTAVPWPPSAAREVSGPATDVAKESSSETNIVAKLTEMALGLGLGQFQVEAMRLPEVYTSDQLRVAIIDTSPNGFWARARQQV